MLTVSQITHDVGVIRELFRDAIGSNLPESLLGLVCRVEHLASRLCMSQEDAALVVFKVQVGPHTISMGLSAEGGKVAWDLFVDDGSDNPWFVDEHKKFYGLGQSEGATTAGAILLLKKVAHVE
jgi:hypothetical protein